MSTNQLNTRFRHWIGSISMMWPAVLKMLSILSIGLICVLLISCTTLKVRNQKIIDDYKSVNADDGVNPAEAYKILKHYMHIQHNYYGVKYFYTEIPQDFGEFWRFSTEFRNSNYENNADDVFFVRVEKDSGKVSSRVIRAGVDDNQQSRIRNRYESIVIADGIDRHEAIAKIKFHYFIEAKNQYSHYVVKFTPIETKKYWVFELTLRPNSPVARQKANADFKKSEALFLVVNKLNGNLFKERSYLNLIN